MTTVGVSDEVWAQLDPRAARLSPQARVRVALWGLAAVALAFAVLLVTASGLLSQRITVMTGASEGDSSSGCWQDLLIRSDGWFDQHVVSATLQPNGTGAVLTRGVGTELESGRARSIRVAYPSRTCDDALPTSDPLAGNVPAPVLVLVLKRPWGTTTTAVRLVPAYGHDGLSISW